MRDDPIDTARLLEMDDFQRQEMIARGKRILAEEAAAKARAAAAEPRTSAPAQEAHAAAAPEAAENARVAGAKVAADAAPASGDRTGREKARAGAAREELAVADTGPKAVRKTRSVHPVLLLGIAFFLVAVAILVSRAR